MSVSEVNELKVALLHVCEKIEALAKKGIKIEFNINTDEHQKTRLTSFRALQEMKLNN